MLLLVVLCRLWKMSSLQDILFKDFVGLNWKEIYLDIEGLIFKQKI